MKVHELDRQSLLAALEGKLANVDKPVEPVWCQKLPITNKDDGGLLSLLKVEGIGIMQVPFLESVSRSLLSSIEFIFNSIAHFCIVVHTKTHFFSDYFYLS